MKKLLNFQNLLPDFICDVVMSQGLRPTGQLFQLNSYENRVYEVALEDGEPIIAKFYRPERWSQKALRDEHFVLQKLFENDIPVVKPLALQNYNDVPTLSRQDEFYYAFFPKFRGHEEADLNDDHRRWLGRTLARLHNVMQTLDIRHRLVLNEQTYGFEQLALLLENSYVPFDLKNHLEDVVSHCLEKISLTHQKNWQTFAVHGDCHLGNVLWNDVGPTLVDFDDMVLAPPVQDIWMLFYGDESEQAHQKKFFFEGYETFRDFDFSSFVLVEPLRTLRMIRHAAWIGQRYEEEIFKRAFPYYSERKYWEELLLHLKEQWSQLQCL